MLCVKVVLALLLLRRTLADDERQNCNQVINIYGKGLSNVRANEDTAGECSADETGHTLDDMLSILENIQERLDKLELSIQDVCVRPRDCLDIQSLGRPTGIYTIYPDSSFVLGIRVRCDMETDGGGWTFIQRRESASNFYRNWDNYKRGFGDLETNFWLGNDNINKLTTLSRNKLRVDITSWDNERAYEEYMDFSVGDEASCYQLSVGEFSGTAGDSLSYHNEMKFSTRDRDNDIHDSHCAELYVGAWWYKGCHHSNLNGLYNNTEFAKGPVWLSWHGYYVPMKNTEMKIRRID